MAPATTVSAGKPTARVIYQFTPLISFPHKDDFGNILSGYEAGMHYSVREGNTKLDAVVQGWMQKEAHDGSPEKKPLGHKLVRMGA